MRERDVIYELDKQWSAKTVRVKKAGGQTNKNYIVTYGKKKFFVRIPWESDMIDRTVEGKNILALSKNKKLSLILPKYHLYIVKKKNIFAVKSKDVFDVPDGTIVAEYIEGRELNGKLLKKKEVQEALVQALYTFHSSGVKFENKYDVFHDEIEKYRAVAEQYPLSTVIGEKALSQMRRIVVITKKGFAAEGGISTHNDLEFENILLGKDGRMYLLDFEYAGFSISGGVHYDLGTLLGDNLFHKYPMTLELFDVIVDLMDEKYQQKFDRQQILYGALADFLVMFWWALAKYFTAETKKEKAYLIEHAMQGVRGAEQIVPLLIK